MTYREWIIANWDKSPTYRKAVKWVEATKKSITTLEKGIEYAERGEVFEECSELTSLFSKPKSFLPVLDRLHEDISDSLIAPMYGVSTDEYRRRKWEKEALEAEEQRKDKIKFFLEMYRDGMWFGKKSEEPVYGSLPHLKKQLAAYQNGLDNCKPYVFDWRNKSQDDWYDNAQHVLSDMFDCLHIDTEYDFNEALPNVLRNLSECRFIFTFIHWTQSFGYTTCLVKTEAIPKQHISRKAWDMWEATLQALLDYIDIHWGVLYNISVSDNSEDG